MRNPVRSEGEAYRFLLLTVVAFAAIAVASLLGGVVAGAATWAVATAAAAFFYLRRGRPTRLVKTAPPHVGAADERRVLVLANEALADESLVDGKLVEEIRHSTAGYREQVCVVCPMPLSSLRRWLSDVDDAREDAEQRLQDTVRMLRARGLEARGQIGDGDALQATEDALRTFGADEIFVVTRSEARRDEVDAAVVARARERFALPITHVLADS